jgi:hypothetical protein
MLPFLSMSRLSVAGKPKSSRADSEESLADYLNLLNRTDPDESVRNVEYML